MLEPHFPFVQMNCVMLGERRLLEVLNTSETKLLVLLETWRHDILLFGELQLFCSLLELVCFAIE